MLDDATSSKDAFLRTVKGAVISNAHQNNNIQNDWIG
jgi:hypothetical protein